MKLYSALSLFIAFFSGMCGATDAKVTYKYSVTSGKTGTVVIGQRTSALVTEVNGNVRFNIGDLSSIGTKLASPGSKMTYNATGTSSIDTKVCAANISWYAQSGVGTQVNGSGNFSFVSTMTGSTSNYAPPGNCGGSCVCSVGASSVFMSAQTTCPSFTSVGNSGTTFTINKTTTGTNYVYLRMGPTNIACGTVSSTNVLQCSWTGIAAGSWSCSQLSMCC